MCFFSVRRVVGTIGVKLLQKSLSQCPCDLQMKSRLTDVLTFPRGRKTHPSHRTRNFCKDKWPKNKKSDFSFIFMRQKKI